MKTESKTSYDKFIAMIVANAVREIEQATGRKVVSLSIPSPRSFDDPEKRPAINVRFEDKPAA